MISGALTGAVFMCEKNKHSDMACYTLTITEAAAMRGACTLS